MFNYNVISVVVRKSRQIPAPAVAIGAGADPGDVIDAVVVVVFPIWSFGPYWPITSIRPLNGKLYRTSVSCVKRFFESCLLVVKYSKCPRSYYSMVPLFI